MKCPFCGADDTQVIDSRVNEEGDSIRRRRKCGACDKRFTTYETAELHMPQVVKTNGTREEFNREKLRLSFSRALHKRPVPTEYVDRALDRISQKLLSLGAVSYTHLDVYKRQILCGFVLCRFIYPGQLYRL